MLKNLGENGRKDPSWSLQDLTLPARRFVRQVVKLGEVHQSWSCLEKRGPRLELLRFSPTFLIEILNIASQLICEAMSKILSKNIKNVRENQRKDQFWSYLYCLIFFAVTVYHVQELSINCLLLGLVFGNYVQTAVSPVWFGGIKLIMIPMILFRGERTPPNAEMSSLSRLNQKQIKDTC